MRMVWAVGSGMKYPLVLVVEGDISRRDFCLHVDVCLSRFCLAIISHFRLINRILTHALHSVESPAVLLYKVNRLTSRIIGVRPRKGFLDVAFSFFTLKYANLQLFC